MFDNPLNENCIRAIRRDAVMTIFFYPGQKNVLV